MGAQGTAIVDFGTGATDASVTITGETGITGASLVDAWLYPGTTADNTTDDHLFEVFERPIAHSIVPGTGFTIFVRCANGMAFGQYRLAWVWN